ncbi:hypothetical protein ABW20_dc0109237 [Dactylellina cionopaga]|nr:hypothetical protein ABW20_dc0109237 [Dactylellina cionopaga]
MAEVALAPSEKSQKKHKSRDLDSITKAERTKNKKRKLKDLVEETPPMTDPSLPPPIPKPTTSTTSTFPSRTLKTAAVSSPYTLTTASRYLSISPAYSATPHIGIQRDHLDPLVFKYDSTLDGVVLLHQNLRFQSPAARILGESPFAFVWCLVEFMLWKPVAGMVLEGWVNNVSPSHLGMLYANVFSVAVTSSGIPEGWKFIAAEDGESGEPMDDADWGGKKNWDDKKGKKDGTELIEGLTRAMGRWVDLDGNEVQGLQKFIITAVKAEGGMLSLEGSFKDEDLPEIVEDEEPQTTSAVEKEVTQIHGRDSDDEESRRRRKERKEMKKRKREGNAD